MLEEGEVTPPPRLQGAQPTPSHCPPDGQCKASMAFVTDSNRPQPFRGLVPVKTDDQSRVRAQPVMPPVAQQRDWGTRGLWPGWRPVPLRPAASAATRTKQRPRQQSAQLQVLQQPGSTDTGTTPKG